MRKLTTYLLISAITLALVAALALGIEIAVVGKAALQQGLPLAIIATVFFASIYVEGLVLTPRGTAEGSNGKQQLTTYFLAKVIRFFLSVTTVVIYGFCGFPQLLIFSINIILCYLATMVLSGIHLSRLQRPVCQNND